MSGGGKNIFGKSTVVCPEMFKNRIPGITSIVSGVEQEILIRDPFSQADKMWVIYGFKNLNKIIQYDSLKDENEPYNYEIAQPRPRQYIFSIEQKQINGYDFVFELSSKT